jgi:signal transduction histidine kinase/ActR/RegA family two-component response regulator
MTPVAGDNPTGFVLALFPFAFAVNAEGRIVQLGATLERVSTGTPTGEPLAARFTPYRSVWPDAAELSGPTVRFVVGDWVTDPSRPPIRLRGECRTFTSETGDGLVWFIGSPFPQDIATLRSWGLTLADFPRHDSTGDYAFALQNMSVALDEARRLLETVTAQAQQLREANTRLEQARREAVEAEAARGRFVANMSHEIRTPLNGILGIARLLLQTQLSGEQRELVLAIYNSRRVLKAIIDDILDFSKLESGHARLESAPFNPAIAIQSACQLYSVDARMKRVRFECHADNLPQQVLGDSIRLSQVVSNLVSNAVKFTTEGSVTVDAHWAAGELTLVVRDTGIGIEPSVLPRLFKPFMQADDSMTRQYGGTGLGLAIVHQIVAQMGGRVDVASEPGAGSTFTVRVPMPVIAPVEAAPNGHDVASPLAVAPVEPAPRRLRVLLAEDNAINALMVRRFVERLGHEVVVAEEGEAALNAALSETYDLLLLDLQMPKLDGLSVARAIRSAKGPRADIPIVAVTANARTEDMDACREAGIDYFLAKPIDFDALESLVEQRARMPLR